MSVSIWEVLTEAGFTHDPNVIAESIGMSLNLMNALQEVCPLEQVDKSAEFILKAGDSLNYYLKPTFLITGLFRTPRTLQEICFELPMEFQSRKQGLALLAHYVPSEFDADGYLPWLREGRQHKNLLPWEQARKTYENQPQAIVARDWLRQALKSARAVLDAKPEIGAIEFSFDGEIMRIRLADVLIAFPSSGKPWPGVYAILAPPPPDLPARLMQDPVTISISDNYLLIGTRGYRVTRATPQSSKSPD